MSRATIGPPAKRHSNAWTIACTEIGDWNAIQMAFRWRADSAILLHAYLAISDMWHSCQILTICKI